MATPVAAVVPSVVMFNGRSSRNRVAVYDGGDTLRRRHDGKIDRIGVNDVTFIVNDLDRGHLVSDVIDRVPSLEADAAYAQQAMRDKLIEHKHYIATHGENLPEIRNWHGGPIRAKKPTHHKKRARAT